jgi:hypothetical protein
MPIFTVWERQVIRYAWDVRAETAEQALATVEEGVPDAAREKLVGSENWVEEAPDDVEPDIDLLEEDDYSDVSVDGVVVASTRRVEL